MVAFPCWLSASLSTVYGLAYHPRTTWNRYSKVTRPNLVWISKQYMGFAERAISGLRLLYFFCLSKVWQAEGFCSCIKILRRKVHKYIQWKRYYWKTRDYQAQEWAEACFVFLRCTLWSAGQAFSTGASARYYEREPKLHWREYKRSAGIAAIIAGYLANIRHVITRESSKRLSTKGCCSFGNALTPDWLWESKLNWSYDANKTRESQHDQDSWPHPILDLAIMQQSILRSVEREVRSLFGKPTNYVFLYRFPPSLGSFIWTFNRYAVLLSNVLLCVAQSLDIR